MDLITIEEIYKNEPLSMRSYHVCKNNGLETLEDIIEFYREKRSFDKLRNCGRKSDEELTGLVIKYKNIDFAFQEIYPMKFESKFKIIISELSRNQKEVINSFIQVNANSLSNRSQNGINSFLENNLKIKNFADKILFADGFDFKKIKNIGAGTVPELEVFVNIVEDFIIEVSKNENDKYLISLKNKFLIQKTFSLPFIPYEILESESIFQLTSFLINQNAFYDKNQTKILTKAFKIYLNSAELTLDEIAKELDLTRERVRQIRKTLFEELFSKLLFVQNFDDNLLEKYNIDNTQCYIEINDAQIEVINNQNKTNFTKEFIIYLIYCYWSNEFDLVGNNEDVLLPKYFNARNRHNWNNFYLVKKDLVLEFDFISLANDISERLNDRIEETYSFSLKSYLSKFLLNNNFEILNSIMKIGEKIINEEFDIYIDIEDNIVFNKNTAKQVPECAIEALQELGNPSKIENIYEWIEKKYPEITKSQEALRGSLQRSNEIIYFGRSSTYGLKKWENEKSNIKGGTIKNLIIDYLEDKDEPVHIYEILDEVHRYREATNAKNIITNLKLDPQKQFIIFNQSFIGLKTKKYSGNLTTFPKFLGKSITGYLKDNKNIYKDDLTKYFSKQLSISLINMEYILKKLIEEDFIKIDDKNKLEI